jgi:hypothetical protein
MRWAGWDGTRGNARIAFNAHISAGVHFNWGGTKVTSVPRTRAPCRGCSSRNANPFRLKQFHLAIGLSVGLC